MSVGDTAPERTFFATCPRGVSELLASELRALGLEVEREHPAGVGFRGTLRSAYLACLRSRTASRILLTLGEVTAADPDAMYQALRSHALGSARAAGGHVRDRYRRRVPGVVAHTRNSRR